MADNLLLPKQNNDALIPDTVNYIEPSHTYDVDLERIAKLGASRQIASHGASNL